MENQPYTLIQDTSTEDELYFHTQGTDIDLAFEIEEDCDDVEEDLFEDIDED